MKENKSFGMIYRYYSSSVYTRSPFISETLDRSFSQHRTSNDMLTRIGMLIRAVAVDFQCCGLVQSFTYSWTPGRCRDLGRLKVLLSIALREFRVHQIL